MAAPFYLTILMYVQLLAPGATAPPGAVVVDVSPGFKGVVVADWSPGAVEIIAPGITGAHGPDKAACEKWGDKVRQAMAIEMKLADYRQLKIRCELRP